MDTHSTFDKIEFLFFFFFWMRSPAYLNANHLSVFRYYCLSTLDKHHHPNITFEEGLKLLEMCTDELKRRLPIDYKGVCYVCLWGRPKQPTHCILFHASGPMRRSRAD